MRKATISAILSVVLLAAPLVVASPSQAATGLRCDGWRFIKSEKFHGRVVRLFKCNHMPYWVGRVSNAREGDYVWLRSNRWRGTNASVSSGATYRDTGAVTSGPSEAMQACAVALGHRGKRCTLTWAHESPSSDRTVTTTP